MNKFSLPNFTLSTTSFLIHENYVPAIRFIAQRCEDISLLLLETGTDGFYLPSKNDIKEIGYICDGEGTSIHIHLPTDGDFSSYQKASMLTEHILTAIERSACLNPSAYVLHIVPTQFPIVEHVNLYSDITDERKAWTARLLSRISQELPSRDMLCIENIESYPPDYWDFWINNSSYSRCIDIGHLWKDRLNPVPYIKQWLPRTKVIHLHGLQKAKEYMEAPTASITSAEQFRSIFEDSPHDHVSLKHIPECCLDDVMHTVWASGYHSILNLEVFSYDDFITSYKCLLDSWYRYLTNKRI